MHPVLLHIGGFKLPAYGFMVALGYAAAIIYLLTAINRGVAALSRERAADLVFYSALAGIMGAKAAYAVTYWPELGPDTASRLVYIFKSFQYGFVFYGGLAAGAAAFFLYCRRHKLDFLATADLLAPALPLAHGFGRLGCFLAGCCYGRPGGGVFGAVFSNPWCEVPQASLNIPLYPVQLYEAAGNFLIFYGLIRLSRRGDSIPHTVPRDAAGGTILSAYILAYAALRFFLEFFRGDDRGGVLLGLSPAQVVSVAAAAAAVFMLSWIRKIKT